MEPQNNIGIPATVARPLRWTLAGMWVERMLQAFWPLATFLLFLFAALSFGVSFGGTLGTFWAGVVAVSTGLVGLLAWGMSRFRRPDRDEALARLDATLAGRPLAFLADRQALGADDPAARVLWRAERARKLADARAVRAVAPDLRLAVRDPFALRYLALTGAVAATLFGAPGGLLAPGGLMPSGASGAGGVATGPSWEGWATPPAYTGLPALYLPDQQAEDLKLPVGTALRLRLYGAPGDLIVAETVSGRTEAGEASAADQSFTLARSGQLSVQGADRAEWQITAIPDQPPTVETEATMRRAKDGAMALTISARDDYGVVGGGGDLTLDLGKVERRYGLAVEPEPRAPMMLDLPHLRVGKDGVARAVLTADLSKDAWANLPVHLKLKVQDAIGQTGVAPPVSGVLPARRFFDPLAAALIEMRRDLMWNRANASRVMQILRAISNHPEELLASESVLLRLRMLVSGLEADAPALSSAQRDAAAEELWQVALLVEEGDLASARERLQRAEEKLGEAIRRGADANEIDRLMQDMRDALEAYTRELAKKGQNDAPAGPSLQMTPEQLQQLLDELQRLMREGKTAEAADLLDQLRRLMENMQLGKSKDGGPGTPGDQTLRDLGQTLRDQQELSDDAFRELQRGGAGSGQKGPSLSDRQGDLRRRLDDLSSDPRLPNAESTPGAEGRQALDDAGRAMEEAEQALKDGNLSGALDSQAKALQALREGLNRLGEAARSATTPGAQQGEPQPSVPNDPFGRGDQDGAQIGSDMDLLTQKDIARRAQELLDEIRRRSGDLARPDNERSYLRRLLELF